MDKLTPDSSLLTSTIETNETGNMVNEAENTLNTVEQIEADKNITKEGEKTEEEDNSPERFLMKVGKVIKQ